VLVLHTIIVMKSSWLLLSLVELAFLAPKASCTDFPLLPYDPETTSDCADWYNNEDGSRSCEWIRDYFRATPEEFSSWNPSLGLDCKPWYDWNSYCIITWAKVNATRSTTTSATTTTSPTTTAPTLGPSPTAWADMGCYVENPEMPLLDIKFNTLNGEASLTIPKCWLTCYRRSFEFAGVQNGNECWCGTYIGGEWAANQTDCNTPCTGDASTSCGGTGLLQIFRAQENVAPVTTTTPITTTAAIGTANPASDAKQDSGAAKNRGMLSNLLG
jgi:hypothetical protein